MNKKENPVHGGNREREEKRAATASAATSKPDFITPSGLISSILSATDAHFTAKQLAKTLGVSDARIITKQIERERKSGGAPICASCGENPGYFWPSTVKELNAYIGSLRKRRQAISATIDGLERARNEWAGQTRIEGIGEPDEGAE